MSDETTVTRHEPMVLERFTLVPGGGRENYREETVCSTCWIKNQDDCLPETVRAPWPCEVVRTRREFVGYLCWRQCDRHAEMTINDAVKASRDALPWVGQKCERCTEDDLAAMIAGNPEATRLASQLKASGDRNLSTVLENARLRERVAVLEAAGNAMVDELVYLSEWGGPGSDYVVYSCHACGVEATSLDAIQHDADCNVKAWLAALAQAGEGGAA